MKYDIEQLLEAGEVIQIYPEGYSMYPMFVPGRDAAVIKKADVKKIRRADVVLYRRKGSILVLHRVEKAVSFIWQGIIRQRWKDRWKRIRSEEF